MLYRINRIRNRIAHHELGFEQWREHPAERSSHCDACAEKRHDGEAGGTLPSPITGLTSFGVLRRASSTSQPHFAETTTRIRRISSDPSRPDTIQRVNSVASTLLTAPQPSSEALPFGGRKGSAGSWMDYSSLVALQAGQVAMGDRRPSALSDPDSGMVSIRRVSVGGGEDVVVVRSGSQSSEARRRSMAAVNAPRPVNQVDSLPSPTLPPSHPFAMVGSSSLGATTQPLKLDKPPKHRSGSHRADRPDSLALTKIRQAGHLQVVIPESPRSVKSADSDVFEALRSPGGIWSANDSPPAELFEAWRGFPLKGSITVASTLDQAQPLSPRTPASTESQVDDGFGATPNVPEAACRSNVNCATVPDVQPTDFVAAGSRPTLLVHPPPLLRTPSFPLVTVHAHCTGEATKSHILQMTSESTRRTGGWTQKPLRQPWPWPVSRSDKWAR